MYNALMNFRQIEAFRTVMASGSVTGAAQLMSISQPAVSRLVGDLERNVGFPLFRKRGRNLVATEEGVALYKEVKRAFVGLEDLKSTAEAIRHCRTGTLNLVTMPGLASRVLPELVAEFSAVHSGVGVWLEVLPRSEALVAIATDQYDVCIASGPIDDRELSAERLCRLQAYCVLPAKHPLSGKQSIRPEDLEGERFISLARDSLFRYQAMMMLEQHEVNCRLDIQARTADAIYGLVGAGLGVSIVGPELPTSMNDDLLAFRPLQPPMHIDIMLITRANTPTSRLGRLFYEHALDHSSRQEADKAVRA